MTFHSTSLDRATAVVLIVHIVAMFAGFTVLGPVFEFPDVLRYPAAERFALFTEGRHIIQPTYWVLTMTGVTQILLSVLLYLSMAGRSQAAPTFGLVFGVLAGFCQALGFGRWVIVIPYLVVEAQHQPEMAALLEGAFNHYAGMLVGEHLANIFWGVWLAATCVALLRNTDVDRRIAWLGLGLSPLLFLLAGEQIGASGDILDPLVDFGFPLLAVWHILLAAQLFKRASSGQFSQMGRSGALIGGTLAFGMIVPVFL